MNKTTSSKTSIKDLNVEYARLFEAYRFTAAFNIFLISWYITRSDL